MSFLPTSEPSSLTAGDDGVVRVGGTRVTLGTVVESFRDGLTPAEIQRQYPSLGLTHVDSAIAYYLHHRSEVEDYLEERARQRAEVRREVEERFDPTGIRERLQARIAASTEPGEGPG